jgi:predicted membrane-bound spermidine synthase
MGLVLIEGVQELREARAFYRWGWLLGGGGVLFFWALPWPLPQGDHEILYTTRLGGERVTLHGRRGEAGRVVSLVSQRSTFYQSVQAYRYAETMTHPAMAMASTPPKRILLVGGEDGAILQELSRYAHSMRVDWLPLFADWAEFFLHAPYFRSRHRAVQQKLAIKRHDLPLFFREDAWFQRLAQLEKGKGQGYDLILADFPPPQHTLAMLNAQKTREILLRLLRPEGYAVAHITSPYRERRLFWCSAGEWARSGAYLLPFQLAPSLIYDHGFLLLRRQPIPALKQPLRIPVPTRYLTPTLPFDALARFARDTSPDGRDMTEECEIPSF